MTELVITIFFELIVLSIIIETIYEWWKPRRHWQLVPTCLEALPRREAELPDHLFGQVSKRYLVRIQNHDRYLCHLNFHPGANLRVYFTLGKNDCCLSPITDGR